ncbi:helix-turn-helix domain-containing protein [Halorussus ruber]|uniref:helix-turn-helix domain-containing protein n=1 Tax=Halorussus ruber TaxID=1126238 RepID=UPI00143DF40D|nr:helix-turn-helix domain-containing protein [Halorussus ruber]
MPISRDEFDASEASETEYSTAEAIIKHLADHDDLAFTRQEIADAIDRNPNTVSTNLSRLKNRGFVEHRGNYWALTEDEEKLEELAEKVGTLQSAKAGFDDETPFIEDEEEAEEWADAAAEYPEGQNTEQSAASAREYPDDGSNRSNTGRT